VKLEASSTKKRNSDDEGFRRADEALYRLFFSILWFFEKQERASRPRS
jgi:hypothetical protein